MWGDGPAHHSVNRAETTLSPLTVGSLGVVHTYPNWDPAFSDWPYQIVAGSYGYSVVPGLISGFNHYITAFHLPSGSVRWRHRIATNFDEWGYVPAVSNGVLFVGGDSAMYALNATTGVALWTTPVAPNSNFDMVTVKGSNVYASTYDGGKVYDFDATTGAIIWSRTPSGCCLTGPVSIAGGFAYVLNSALHVYNANTGKPVFTTGSGYYETPAVSNGVVYIQAVNNLVARNASTGALLWSSHTMSGNSVSSLTPALDGNTIVVGTTRYLIAFNATSGARLWTIDGGSGSTDYLVPAIANGVVYAGSIGRGLQAVDEASGKVLFSGGSICWSAIVSHGEVFLPCDVGMTVFGLNPVPPLAMSHRVVGRTVS
jgi:outer membrane protein assembly factor BamB